MDMDKIVVVLPRGVSTYMMWDSRLLDMCDIYLDGAEYICLDGIVYSFIFNMIYIYNYIKDKRKYIKIFKIERGN